MSWQIAMAEAAESLRFFYTLRHVIVRYAD